MNPNDLENTAAATDNTEHQVTAFLNHQLVPGLFQTCDGQNFVVATHAGRKIAVQFDGPEQLRVSQNKLDGLHWVCSNWWAAANVRLHRLLSHPISADTPGIISFERDGVYLSCFSDADGVIQAKVGLRSPTFEGLAFDRWSIDPSAVPHPCLRGSFEAARGTLPLILHDDRELADQVHCSKRYPPLHHTASNIPSANWSRRLRRSRAEAAATLPTSRSYSVTGGETNFHAQSWRLKC
jgi:hypothetical protein